MADILLGLLAIIAGVAMLLAGQLVLRLMLPIWGFFAGFASGAALAASRATPPRLPRVVGVRSNRHQVGLRQPRIGPRVT